jgi:hypothetical protein
LIGGEEECRFAEFVAMRIPRLVYRALIHCCGADLPEPLCRVVAYGASRMRGSRLTPGMSEWDLSEHPALPIRPL